MEKSDLPSSEIYLKKSKERYTLFLAIYPISISKLGLNESK